MVINGIYMCILDFHDLLKSSKLFVTNFFNNFHSWYLDLSYTTVREFKTIGFSKNKALSNIAQ